MTPHPRTAAKAIQDLLLSKLASTLSNPPSSHTKYCRGFRKMGWSEDIPNAVGNEGIPRMLFRGHPDKIKMGGKTWGSPGSSRLERYACTRHEHANFCHRVLALGKWVTESDALIRRGLSINGLRGPPLQRLLASRGHPQLPLEVWNCAGLFGSPSLGTHPEIRARHNSVHLTLIINTRCSLCTLGRSEHLSSNRGRPSQAIRPCHPSTQGLSAALTRRFLARSELSVIAIYHQWCPEKVKTRLLRPLDGVAPPG